jgi:hypothetical protein
MGENVGEIGGLETVIYANLSRIGCGDGEDSFEETYVKVWSVHLKMAKMTRVGSN